MTDSKKPYYRLRVDVTQALNPKFNADEFLKSSRSVDQPMSVWFMDSTRADNRIDNFLNKNWLDYMESLGLPVQSFLMFYRTPGVEYPYAHTDIGWSTNKPYPFAVNWVFSNNDDSEMIWYDVPNETGEFLVEQQAKVKYLSWDINEIRNCELSRVVVGSQLTMVNTGIAHNVVTKNNSRWSISLRWPKHLCFDSWQESVDYFNKIGIIDPCY